MEIVGAFVDEEWDSLSKMFSENPDSFDLHYDGEIPFLPTSDHHHSFNTNFCSNAISQESSNNGEIETTHFLDEDHQPFIHDYNNTFDESMSFYNMDGSLMMMMPVFPDHVMEEILHSKGENRAPETGDDSKLKRKYDQDVSENHSHESSPKKIPRVSRNAQKNSRKNKKKIQEANNEEEGNKQCSSNCSSEDDSNDSKAKAKANRGSATDPQSLYARRRRERINERLKILQNLVPNGTKVDISTMLEEAVQYVKFLQLQIKLLSSDDMWMYAPLAYNGMDLGIYHNISPNLTAHN